jgi:hypothetical protein
MKTIFKNAFTVVVFMLLLSGFGSCFTATAQPEVVQYSNPPWAPVYSPGVRYYYIPDIETYYDLTNQDFVYLDDGQWVFSNTLPPIYSGFDLYNAFIIALDINVFQPWMHHHFYLAHYPRFYYHNVYHETEIANIRGFNENIEKPFYTTPADRARMTELSRNNKPVQEYKMTRQPQKPNYYGKTIGQHVKVQPQMRQNTQAPQRRAPQGGNQGHGNQGVKGGQERH